MANINLQQSGGGSGGGGGVTSLTGDSVVYNNAASTGVVTLSIISQVANKFFAGPASGGSVAPTWRSMVIADLPTAIPNANLANASITINGDGALLSSPGATALGATAALTLNAQAANLVLAGPTSGGSVAPTFRSLVAADLASGLVTWDKIGNAGAGLTLSNGANTTEFDQTTNATWLWNNTTIATVSTTNNTPQLQLGAKYWTGAASAQDTWSISAALAAGTNGVPSLNITHSGSSGVARIIAPGVANVYGWAGGTGGMGPSGGGANFVGLYVSGAETARVASTSVSTAASVGLDLGGGVGSSGKFAVAGGTGIVSRYNNIATVSGGVPSELATIDLTGQVAAIVATTLYTPTATGMFRISAYLKITTTGTSPVLGPVTIAFTDGTDSVAQSFVMQLSTQAGASATSNAGNTTTSALNGETVIWAKTGVAITYAVALTGTVGTGAYEVHLKCEAL